MKLKIAVLTVAAAALGASAAFATPPATHPTHPTTPASTNAATPKVMFVLHGTLSGYTAANGATNGSVTLTLSSWNRGTFTKGQVLTFVVSSSTHVTLHDSNTSPNGDRGIVKVRATKAATVNGSTAFQIIDQGTAS